ncbi:hypothetical protein JCGZ_03108 [Jatropha curcas]|uniref:Uncharacterized protein n=1 Tax=Jatropha curcas TaxID=180498 RepID=A0A067JDV9_JATCU|nr:hypothetical protein JCGZ_03108 [Jatropha curcas]
MGAKRLGRNQSLKTIKPRSNGLHQGDSAELIIISPKDELHMWNTLSISSSERICLPARMSSGGE